MSRIYFHSPHGDAEVRGTERAWFGHVVDRIGLGFLDIDHNIDELMATVPDWGLESVKPEFRARQLATALSVGMRSEPTVDGKPYEAFAMFLNTALSFGNDAVKLAARIHGQCEIHAWANGPNRAWLADIIDTGDTAIIRPEAGWESVVDLLRTRDDEPVVTSYSVTDGFPSSFASDWDPWPVGVPEKWDALSTEEQERRQAREEEWWELPVAEQWEHGLGWLTTSNNGQELKPDNWATMRFNHSLNSVQFLDLLRESNRIVAG